MSDPVCIRLTELEAHGDAMRRLAAAMLGDPARARTVVRDCQLASLAALHAGAVSVSREQLGPWLLDHTARCAARDVLRRGAATA